MLRAMRHPPLARPGRRAPIVALAAVALTLASTLGCSGKKKDAPDPSASSAAAEARCVFRYALPEPPGSLDPAFARSSLENLVAPNLFEGLMNYPEADGPPIPGVAERFEVSADGLTYTFHLRADAKWSDGQPVTARDFDYAWRRVLDPKTGAPYADIMYVIAGAAEAHAGQGDPKAIGIEAPDDRTLIVRLRHPAPYFPELTAFFTYLPVPRRAVEAHGDRWTRPEHIVTNGAFRLAGHEYGARLLLARDPTYWGVAEVGAERVEIRFVNDGSTVVTLVETGDLDWTGLVDLPPVRLPVLRRTPLFRADPWMATHYLRLNTTAPPFDDPRVREAVALALDRSVLAKMARGGRAAAGGFVPPMPGWTPPKPTDGDPDRARALLTEAGYGPEKPLTFRLHFPNDEFRRLLAQLLAAQLEKHLGAKVETWTEEFRVYLQTQDRLGYAASLSRWAGDYADPTTFLEMWTSASLHNKTGWTDPAYDALIARAQRTVDAEARRRLLAQAEAKVLSAAPIVPVVYGAKAFLLRPGFTGLGVNSLGNHLMRHIACADAAPGG